MSNRTITIAITFLFAISVLVTFVARASTLSRALLVEWAVVLLVFAIFIAVIYSVLKRVVGKQTRIKIDAPDLNPRERDMLHLIAEGYSNKEIALELLISESTVKKHVTSLYRKLGAKRRTDALRRARDNGLVN